MLKKRLYLGLSLIGRIFLGKIEFEKSPKNGQILPKGKGVNLNFLTIFDDFWDFLKMLKKASSGEMYKTLISPLAFGIKRPWLLVKHLATQSDGIGFVSDKGHTSMA